MKLKGFLQKNVNYSGLKSVDYYKFKIKFNSFEKYSIKAFFLRKISFLTSYIQVEMFKSSQITFFKKKKIKSNH